LREEQGSYEANPKKVSVTGGGRVKKENSEEQPDLRQNSTIEQILEGTSLKEKNRGTVKKVQGKAVVRNFRQEDQ